MRSVFKYFLVLSVLMFGVVSCGSVALGSVGPQPCELTVYEAPGWADPNLIVGYVLPASTDPNTGEVGYTATAGNVSRRGRACDPDGDPITVDCNTPGWKVTLYTPDRSPGEGTWTLTGYLHMGPNYIYVSIIDAPKDGLAIRERFTVCVWGEPAHNRPPVLR